MNFSTETEPLRHIAEPLFDDVSRLVANNASRMTYHGTNTYLLRTSEGCVVIDPGPLDDVHSADLLAATGGSIAGIVLTHHHVDHIGGAARLRDLSGAPITAFRTFASGLVEPDRRIDDGERAYGLMALHTPGHASDHISLALDDGRLFSGDHVMSWATSVVSPPDGNMNEYLQSLTLLIDRDDSVYLPGHGPILNSPQHYVQALLAHRLAKESHIVRLLAESTLTTSQLANLLHRHADPRLRAAAERTITAHLERLAVKKCIRRVDDAWEYVA